MVSFHFTFLSLNLFCIYNFFGHCYKHYMANVWRWAPKKSWICFTFFSFHHDGQIKSDDRSNRSNTNNNNKGGSELLFFKCGLSFNLKNLNIVSKFLVLYLLENLSIFCLYGIFMVRKIIFNFNTLLSV